MAKVSYRAEKGTEVSSTINDHNVLMVFKDGTYTTADLDEIAVLDAVAELEDHPVSFAPKE